MPDDNKENRSEWNWPVIWIITGVMATSSIYEIVDTIGLNRALEACAVSGGDIHVTWNGRHYCDHEKDQRR